MWTDRPAGRVVSTRGDLPRMARLAVIMLVTGLFAAAFAGVPWPRIDLYNTLQQAETLSWAETIRVALTNSADFRPLMTVATKMAYETGGLHLWFYKGIVLAQFALLLWVLLILWQPSDWKRAAAAVVALACFLGLHTSRVMLLFLPLNGSSVVMTLIVLAAIIVLDPSGRQVELWLLPLTLLALLLVEFGIFVVPVVLVAWWLGAPGITWRGVVAVFVAAAAYLIARHLIGAPVAELWATETGLGFDDVPPQQLKATFAHAPWLLWLHNIGVSLLTVVASEPRAGKFKFVFALLRGTAREWQWLHVLSSVLTTAVIVAVLASVRTIPPRDRVLAAIGAVLLCGGSAIGFLYTRDRIALPAGLGYAILLFVALSVLLERTSVTVVRRAAAALLVGLLGVCWTWRSAEAAVDLRDRAWDYYLEWTVRYQHDGPETPLLQALHRWVLTHRPPDPRRDAAWTYRWFERQFDRIDEP